MRFRILAALALAAAIGVVANAAAPNLRQGTAFFLKPTLVAGQYIMGPVLFVHDEGKMASGQACTAIYDYSDNVKGRELVSFHCKRVARPLANQVKVTCKDRADLKTMVMTEYQLPGEAEGHEVPAR
jgi:hypothetical protein